MLDRHLLGGVADTISMLALRALAHLQDTVRMVSFRTSTRVQYRIVLSLVDKQSMQSPVQVPNAERRAGQWFRASQIIS
jgi:hypothetical protein